MGAADRAATAVPATTLVPLMAELEPRTPITPVPMPTDLSLVPAASSPIQFPAPASGADFNTVATAIADSDDSEEVTLSQVTGTFAIGGNLVGAGVPVGLTITGQVSGPPGGAGVYTTSEVTTLDAVPVTGFLTLPIEPGGDSPPIVVPPGTYIPGEQRSKQGGNNPYTLALPTFAFMPLVQGVKFNLSAVPPWQTEGPAAPATPPPLLTMTRTPPFPAYPS